MSAMLRHAPYLIASLRRQFPYTRGKVVLTVGRDVGAPLYGQARHKAGEFQQVHDPEKRPPTSHEDFRIRRDGVSPLRWNRADGFVVHTQQEPLAKPVIAFPNTDELLVGKRMEGMSYPDKMLRSGKNVCIPE